MDYSEEFYRNKNVLITGHTGFKGTWMCNVLIMAGARVTGYALKPESSENLFDISKVQKNMNSIIGDIRDLDHLKRVFEEVQPEIVIHMAAQPIVRESYKNPVYTYETNVMGTVNVLECIRLNDCVKSFVNVTTDKVYKNREWAWGYRENEELNGYDPYSNSKSCSELVTSSYKNSFFEDRDIAVTTCRAGNVIGGGDFAIDRIIPDCVRAARANKDIIVRNPYSVRPYQHVLEPVIAYLMIAQEQYDNYGLEGSYNIGPNDRDCITTGDLVDIFCAKWNEVAGANVRRINMMENGPHEASYLKLDCSKIKQTFGWKSRWNIDIAIDKIVEWTFCYTNQGDIDYCMEKQIVEYLKQ